MTTIISTTNGKMSQIDVTGHAGYAERGKDIVCAGVSVLTATLINALINLRDNKHVSRLRYKIDEARGEAHICFISHTDIAEAAVNTALTGYLMMANQYPEYVKFKEN